MPESTCLHIQDHESAPIRVVDIPWISVRIGRAAFCEVRLTDPDLADEACRLYRRGRSWHLVPIKGAKKGKAQIQLDGRAIDAATPLPFDVPFRIGSFCLTLRQDRAVDPDWEMYPGAAPARKTWSKSTFAAAPAGQAFTERPDLVVESRTINEPGVRAERPEKRRPEPPAPASPADAGRPAASLKDRWETRWRAAGVELEGTGQNERGQRRAQRFDAPGRFPVRAAQDGDVSSQTSEPSGPGQAAGRPRPFSVRERQDRLARRRAGSRATKSAATLGYRLARHGRQ